MKEKIRQFTLNSGLRVLMYDIPNVQSVRISVIEKGGSLGETNNNSGLAHFMEHMLLQGTPTYPTVNELNKYIESMAGYKNASTSMYNVTLWLHLPYTHLREGLELSSEIWFHSSFTPDSVEKERQAVLAETSRNRDNEEYKRYRYYIEKRYKKDSLITVEQSQPESVKKLTRKQMVEFWEKYFVPSNTSLLVVGNLDLEETEAWARKYFSQSNALTAPGQLTSQTTELQKLGVHMRHEPKYNNNYIDVTFGSVDVFASRRDRLIQSLILTQLGYLSTGRLFKRLRSDHGLVYTCGSTSSKMRGIGLVDVYTEVSNENFFKAMDIIVDEIGSIRTKGLTREEFDFVKKYYVDSVHMDFDSLQQINDFIKYDFMWEDDVMLIDEKIALLETITYEDISNFIKGKWDFSKVQIITQGPLGDNEENKAILERYLKKLSIS